MVRIEEHFSQVIHTMVVYEWGRPNGGIQTLHEMETLGACIEHVAPAYDTHKQDYDNTRLLLVVYLLVAYLQESPCHC